MKRRISHISVHHAAKLCAVFYGLLALLFAPFVWVASLADPEGGFPFLFALLFPLVYAVFGYIFTALAVALYNAIAARMGGLEFTVTSVEDADRML